MRSGGPGSRTGSNLPAPVSTSSIRAEAAALLEEVRAIEPAADGLETLLAQAADAVRALEAHEQRVRGVEAVCTAATRHLLDGQLEGALERARAALALDAGHDEARNLGSDSRAAD